MDINRGIYFLTIQITFVLQNETTFFFIVQTDSLHDDDTVSVYVTYSNVSNYLKVFCYKRTLFYG